MRRVAAASMVGTTLEYYDFAVYNSLAALIFNRLFFPSFDPLSGTILAFSTFAVGYLARPLGGILFGRLGDTRGRRFVLVATLLLMGLTTGLIGVLPGYSRAGVFSPIALVVLRFLQGAALGGEWAGAVLLSLEHGRQDRRGLNGAWAQSGPSVGTLLATGFIAAITHGLSAEEFQAWGWRIPFLVSVVLVGFGLWVRSGVEETPLFNELIAHDAQVKAPIAEVLRSHWSRLLIAGGSRIGSDVMYSLLAAFTLTYLTTVLHQSKSLALSAVSIGVAINALTIPCCGRLSDRFGRRVVCGLGALLALGWGFGFFHLLGSLDARTIVLAVGSGFFIHAFMYGPQAAFITEQFPTRLRYAGSSLAYTWVGILGGGIAPLIFASLLRWYRTSFTLSLYLAGALCVTGVALFSARETAHQALEP
jgi:MFS family permease